MLYTNYFKKIFLTLFTPKALFPVKIGFGQHVIYQTNSYVYIQQICFYNRFDSPKKKEIKKTELFSSKTAGKGGKINNGFRTDNVLTFYSTPLFFMR